MSRLDVEEERSRLSRAESREIRRRSRRLLGSLVAPVRWRLLGALAVIVMSTIAQVAGPAILAFGIDDGLPEFLAGRPGPVLLIAAAYLGTAVVGALGAAWFTMLAAQANQRMLYDLRRRMYLHAQRLSLEFHESYTSGRIIARQTSDLEAIRELLDGGLNGLVRGVLFMSFTGVALVALDPPSGLVLLGAMVPLVVLVRWFQVRSEVAFRDTRVFSARLIVHFVETMTGIRAVQAFRTEARGAQRFAEHVEGYRAATSRSIMLFGVLDPGLKLIGNLSVVAVLLIGALRVVDGGLEVGALLAVVLYTRRFFDPTAQMAGFYNAYQSASAALEKISGVLAQDLSVPDPTSPVGLAVPRGAVDFRAVRFAYRDDRVVLPEFDLRIPAGQTIALVGSTGAGKSTLAKLLARFYDPSTGRIELDGVDLRKLHPKDLRRAIVMVTQEAYLFSGTVGENIALGKPGATQEEIEAAARAVGAHEFILELPDGYATDVNKRGGRVSAGQRQLISFARAFLADPAVLILDEATASLDIPSERLVQRGLETLLADRTAIIIAHRLSTVAIAHRVLVMEHGRIVEDGPPAELIGGTGRFAKLHAAWRDSLV
ncbi:MAG: ABC transporter ATP-binding protein [Actinomycetales bacterium]|nr:ABC transporter ATP-binding protein [Actinomycetales bacterium]